jgi:hypothetical protein
MAAAPSFVQLSLSVNCPARTDRPPGPDRHGAAGKDDFHIPVGPRRFGRELRRLRRLLFRKALLGLGEFDPTGASVTIPNNSLLPSAINGCINHILQPTDDSLQP